MLSNPCRPRLPLAGLVVGLVCLLLIPFLYSHVTYYRTYVKTVSLQVGALVLFIAALASAGRMRAVFLPGNRLSLAIWAWLSIQCLSILLLKDRWLAAAPLAQQIPLGLSAVMLMAGLADRPKVLRGALSAYVVVLAAVAVLLAVAGEPLLSRWPEPVRSLFVGFGADPDRVEFIFFSNRDLAGAFLILPIVLSAAVLLTGLRERVPLGQMLAALGLLAVCVWVLYLTRCLSGLVSSAAGIYLVTWVLFRNLRRPLLAGLVGGAVVLGLTVLLVPALRDRVWHGVYYSTAGVRLLMWGGATDAFLHTWGLGSGIGSFFVSYAQWELPAYYGHPNAALAVFYAHDYYLHVAVELGVIGLAALVWLMAEGVRAGRSAWQRSSGPAAALRIGLLGGLAGLLVDALFSVSPHLPEVQIHFWMILAFFGAEEVSGLARPAEDTQPGLLASAARVLSGCAGIGLLLLVIYRGLIPECDLSRGVRLRAQAVEILKAPLTDEKAETDRAAALFDRSIQYLELAHLNTYEPEVFIYSAEYLAPIRGQFRGELAEALNLYREIDRLCPGFGDIDRRIAELLAARGEWQAAARELLKYLGKNRFDVSAYEQLLLLAEEHHSGEVARSALELLGYAIPVVAWDRDRDLRLRQLYPRFQKIALEGDEDEPPSGRP